MNPINHDFFILGEPIETKFGKVRFLTYSEYLQNIAYVNHVSMTPLHLYYNYKEQIEAASVSKDDLQQALDAMQFLKKISLYDLLADSEEFLQAYQHLFGMVLEEIGALDYIFSSEEVFTEFRNLFMEMNMIKEEEVSENELIQEFFEKSKRAKRKDKGQTTFSDMISSIVVGTGFNYNDVKEMTVLQVHATFYRIAAMKNYDTSTLWATIPSDSKVEIEDWAKHIDLFEKEKHGMSMREFNKKFGSLF